MPTRGAAPERAKRPAARPAAGSTRSVRAATGAGGAPRGTGGTDKDIAAKAFEERQQRRRTPRTTETTELVTGRNSVLEALEARIPATTLYLAQRIEFDDRVKSIISIANARKIPLVEVTRQELDRMGSEGTVHQGVGLKVPPYQYRHPFDLVDELLAAGPRPAPRRARRDHRPAEPRRDHPVGRGLRRPRRHRPGSPERRCDGRRVEDVGGRGRRIPVTMASTSPTTLKDLQTRGFTVLGLDGGGSVALPDLGTEAAGPLVVVVGSEGKGLSRLVAETCDAIVSIPIDSGTESLNAGIAASVVLYAVSRARTSPSTSPACRARSRRDGRGRARRTAPAADAARR